MYLAYHSCIAVVAGPLRTLRSIESCFVALYSVRKMRRACLNARQSFC